MAGGLYCRNRLRKLLCGINIRLQGGSSGGTRSAWKLTRYWVPIAKPDIDWLMLACAGIFQERRMGAVRDNPIVEHYGGLLRLTPT